MNARRALPALPREGSAQLPRALAAQPLLPLLVVMVVVVQVSAHGFLSVVNLRGIALDSATLATVAVPAALLIISGYIDLSVGSTLALGGVVAGRLLADAHAPAALAVVAGVAVGALVGAINGLVCCYLRLSPFVVTLGTLTAARGLALLISPLPTSGYPIGFRFLGIGAVATVPVSVIIAVVVLVLGALFLAVSPTGRHVYAIGVNPEAAYLSGIAVRRLPFVLYLVSGAAAGLGGVVVAARLDSAPAGSLGVGFELTVLTAVLLGGVTLTGGRGGILGVLLGVVFLGVLTNGLTLLGVQQAWQQVASGTALVVAIALGLLGERARRSRPPLAGPPPPEPSAAALTEPDTLDRPERSATALETS